MLTLTLNIIDARGRSCPEPVLLTKKGLAKHPEGIQVIVDSVTAKANVARFAKHEGYNVEIAKNDLDYTLTIRKND